MTLSSSLVDRVSHSLHLVCGFGGEIANESPLISVIVCARRSKTLSSSTQRTGMQMHS